MTRIVQDMGKMQRMDPKVTLDILLDKVFESPGSRKVTVLGPNRRGIKLAVVVTDPEEVQKPENLGSVKVEFSCCTIMKRIMVI